MPSAKREIYKNKNLTIFRLSGELTLEEIISTANLFYSDEITDNVIFDITKTSFRNITNENVLEVVNLTTGHAKQLRKTGKTAIVVSDDTSFGLSRMYELLSDKNNHPVDHAVFKNVQEAMIWIQQSK